MKKILVTITSVLLVGATQAATRTAPDNSAVNQRDRAAHEVTAGQQSFSERDTQITRQIRQAIVANDKLSTYAHNVKIITINGSVTLKGPVETAGERDEIYRQAVRVAGRNFVVNELEIAKSE